MYFWYLKQKLILHFLQYNFISKVMQSHTNGGEKKCDRNANGGGILLYIREDIPSTLLHSEFSIFRWNKIKEKTWLLCGSHNP